MGFHVTVMLLVAAILATTDAALRPDRLNSLRLTHKDDPVQRDNPDSTSDDEERGRRTTALVLSVIRASVAKCKPQLLTEIVAGMQKPPKEVRALVRRDKATAMEIFKHQPWVSYFKYARRRKKRVAIVSTLAERFGDRALASKIIALKGAKIKALKRLAASAQATQVHIWTKQRKSAEDVFRFLNLDKVAERKTAGTTIKEDVASLFDNAEFGIWTDYVRGLYEPDDQKAEAIMIETLTTFYGDGRLAKMLSRAKRIDETENLATRLLEAQLKNWLNRDVTPKQVHVWMRVRRQTMDEQEIAWLVEYTKDYANLNPV
ncbi:unnamed protein product [Hyaloperonospora brassicae]|uniref:RxLR effector candidate protein n=1 Tax=Hyaloperonospora brassicae TaxID=162125 RepID=A0AAV0THH1_HYABA|nr:unnamed protein product [Hyaloperonospora brassicae]